MSEPSAVQDSHAVAGTPQGAPAEPAPVARKLFDDGELKQFAADDRKAGGTIGKLLAFFFLYTILAMSIAAYWTYQSIAE